MVFHRAFAGVLIAVAGAAAQQQASGPSSNVWGSMLPMMVVMFVIIYFLMIRPEQKKQKDRQKMINNITKGDRVATIGGLLGTVGNVKDNSVMVKVADSTVVEVRKGAISEVVVDKTDGSKEKDKGKK